MRERPGSHPNNMGDEVCGRAPKATWPHLVFKDDVPRAVSVHVDGIMEALVKIYDAHRVAKELTGK